MANGWKPEIDDKSGGKTAPAPDHAQPQGVWETISSYLHAKAPESQTAANGAEKTAQAKPVGEAAVKPVGDAAAKPVQDDQVKAANAFREYLAGLINRKPFEATNLPNACDATPQAPGMSHAPLAEVCNIDPKVIAGKFQSATVQISTYNNDGSANSGSGYPVCDGDVCSIVTNNHVTETAASVNVMWDTSFGHIRESRTVPILAATPAPDVSLLAFDQKQMPGLTPSKFNVDPLKPSDVIFSIGHPFGLGDKVVAAGQMIEEKKNVAVEGGSKPLPTTYSTSMDAHPGSSGSPDFDPKGDVRGTTTAIDPGRTELTPASDVVSVMRDPNNAKKLRAPQPEFPAGKLYYNGFDFRQASKVDVNANGDSHVVFAKIFEDEPTEGTIFKSGETTQVGPGGTIRKDKDNNVIGADSPDGKPIYRIEREGGGIRSLIEYGPDGRPERTFLRVGDEKNRAVDALMSDYRAADLGMPGVPGLKGADDKFDSFYEVDSRTHMPTSFFPQPMNIEATADGIIRKTVPDWSYLFTGQTKTTYESPGHNFNASEDRDKRTIQLSGGIQEVLDKNTNRTTVTWPTGDGKVGSISDVTAVSKYKGNTWVKNADQSILFTGDGTARWESNGNQSFTVFNTKSNQITAQADRFGYAQWRFNDTLASTATGQQFSAADWNLKQRSVDQDHNIVLKSVDGKDTAKIHPDGNFEVDHAGRVTQFDRITGISKVTANNKLIEINIPESDGKAAAQKFVPVYDGNKMVGLQNGATTNKFQPPGTDYHFDPKTAKIVSDSTDIGGMKLHKEWDAARNDYMIVKEKKVNAATSIDSLSTEPNNLIMDQDPKFLPGPSEPNPLSQRFSQLNEDDLKKLSQDKTLSVEETRDAYRERYARSELATSVMSLPEEIKRTQDALRLGHPIVMNSTNTNVELSKTLPLDQEHRMMYHQQLNAAFLALKGQIDVSDEYANFLTDHKIDPTKDEVIRQTRKLVAALKAPAKGDTPSWPGLMRKEGAQLLVDSSKVDDDSKEKLQSMDKALTDFLAQLDKHK